MQEKVKEFLQNEIFTHCKTILSIYVKNKKFFYHGRPKEDEYLILNQIQNRKPKDIPINYHNIINKAFDSLGFKANRSNSLFCTSDYNTAKEYATFGKVYVVFPYDGFSYLWSPHIQDFAEHVEDLIENVAREIDNEIKDRSFFVTGSKNFGFNLDGKYFVPEQNEKFFLMDLELIFSKTYYSIFEVFEDYPDLFDFNNIKSKKKAEQLKQILEDNCYKITDEEKYYESMFYKNLKDSLQSLYKNTNLSSALLLPVEVMINAEKFILIDSNLISDINSLKKFLQL